MSSALAGEGVTEYEVTHSERIAQAKRAESAETEARRWKNCAMKQQDDIARLNDKCKEYNVQQTDYAKKCDALEAAEHERDQLRERVRELEGHCVSCANAAFSNEHKHRLDPQKYPRASNSQAEQRDERDRLDRMVSPMFPAILKAAMKAEDAEGCSIDGAALVVAVNMAKRIDAHLAAKREVHHDLSCNITQRRIMGAANGPIGGCSRR